MGIRKGFEEFFSLRGRRLKGKGKGVWERGKFFCFCSNLSKDNIISALRPSLKMIVENYIFWSEIRSGFREPGAHPH